MTEELSEECKSEVGGKNGVSQEENGGKDRVGMQKLNEGPLDF